MTSPICEDAGRCESIRPPVCIAITGMPAGDVRQMVEVAVEGGELDVWLLRIRRSQGVNELELRPVNPEVQRTKNDTFLA